MGKWEDTEMFYHPSGKEEKIIPEQDRIGLVESLKRLYCLKGILSDLELVEYVAALDSILVWIDEAVLLFRSYGGGCI